MIIAIAHNKGGVGKTTTLMQLAGAMQPSLIIDLDAHQGISIINSLRGADEQWKVVVPTDDAHLRSLLETDHSGIVMIDCGGFDSTRTRAAIAFCDLLICPSNDDLSEQIGLARMHGIIADISKAIERQIIAHVLMTRCNPARKNFDAIAERIEELPHMRLMASKLSRRQDFPAAMSQGLGVTERERTRHTEAAAEVNALTKEISALLV